MGANLGGNHSAVIGAPLPPPPQQGHYSEYKHKYHACCSSYSHYTYLIFISKSVFQLVSSLYQQKYDKADKCSGIVRYTSIDFVSF